MSGWATAAARVSLRAALLSAAGLIVVLGAASVVAAVESGGGPSLPSLAALLGPVSLAAAVAVVLGEERRVGRWSGWEALGRDPRWLLLPLVAVALLSAALQAGPGHRAAPLPAPVEPTAAWWDHEAAAWAAPPPAEWMRRPEELGVRQLIARSRQAPPQGARRTVDSAEIARRAGQGLAWLLALPVGAAIDGRRRPRRSLVANGAGAAVLLVAWQIAVLLVASAIAAP